MQTSGPDGLLSNRDYNYYNIVGYDINSDRFNPLLPLTDEDKRLVEESQRPLPQQLSYDDDDEEAD
jgi:hypothetical protein